MPTAKPLSPRQQRAAALIGQGWMKKRVAAEVGVHPRTLSKWAAREEFEALVARARASVVAEVPTAQETLQAALAATTSSGAPDWKTRVSAARALIGADGPTEPAAEREVEIFFENLEAAE